MFSSSAPVYCWASWPGRSGTSGQPRDFVPPACPVPQIYVVLFLKPKECANKRARRAHINTQKTQENSQIKSRTVDRGAGEEKRKRERECAAAGDGSSEGIDLKVKPEYTECGRVHTGA